MDFTEKLVRSIEQMAVIADRYVNPKLLIEPPQGCPSLLFTAEDTFTGNSVVLKFLHPFIEDPYWRAAFEREEQLLSELKGNSYVVEILEANCAIQLNLANSEGTESPVNLRFLTLERGIKDLSEYIKSSDREPLQTLQLFRELCRAVQELHKQGISHRDLKPNNCVLFHDGSLKLIDFALSYREGSSVLSQGERYNRWYSIFIPNHLYGAPELYCGFAFTPTQFPVADFFQLGAILFELWTGSRLMDFLYQRDFMLDFGHLFCYVKDGRRRDNYRRAIHVIKKKYPLPRVTDLTTGPWSHGSEIINEVYQAMAELDYEQRCTDFDWVQSQLDKAIDQIMAYQ
ncbi:serine/threonine protein kinase [Heyndrickxia sporothermodurans]|uniref:serine/threonine protein kinase n=1 Tax=Heyndrickxia sporothermodurans TaxID=46224 RepID=UPI002E1F4DAC|nr:protein kinase [Heyndrickxia sporothermodurans]MED3652623.1 protein kinase [Heyndrickxia sporothermodurans]MED3696815.1 protein kinase [Heyndrickxia sporothermodurans]MED3780644.1 protein kinase [Heyndrickxia sporothermodurans]